MRHPEQGSVKGQNKWDVASVACKGNRRRNANAMTRANFNAMGDIVVWDQPADARSGQMGQNKWDASCGRSRTQRKGLATIEDVSGFRVSVSKVLSRA